MAEKSTLEQVASRLSISFTLSMRIRHRPDCSVVIDVDHSLISSFSNH